VKTAISFIHQYMANHEERLQWIEGGKHESEKLKSAYPFKLHPVHRIWWSLLSMRADLTREFMRMYSNVPAAIMLLSRSGFTEMCMQKKSKKKGSTRIYSKLFIDLADDLSQRLFRRLGNINEVSITFKTQILPRFAPGSIGPEGLLFGDPKSSNEALLECLLFAGLPRGTRGETLIYTLNQLSDSGSVHSPIGSLDFLEAMKDAPKASQQSEILDNIIDFIWESRYQAWWQFEFFLFLIYFILNMFMLTGGIITEVELQTQKVSAFIVWPVIVINSWFLVKEMIQMSLRHDGDTAKYPHVIKILVIFWRYLGEETNAIDITAIFLGFVFPVAWIKDSKYIYAPSEDDSEVVSVVVREYSGVDPFQFRHQNFRYESSNPSLPRFSSSNLRTNEITL
jgi:hypothetical protein